MFANDDPMQTPDSLNVRELYIGALGWQKQHRESLLLLPLLVFRQGLDLHFREAGVRAVEVAY